MTRAVSDRVRLEGAVSVNEELDILGVILRRVPFEA